MPLLPQMTVGPLKEIPKKSGPCALCVLDEISVTLYRRISGTLPSPIDRSAFSLGVDVIN